MTRYVIINTMDKMDVFCGKVVSVHHSLESAEKHDCKLQRSVKRANGSDSYLPTVICETETAYKKGDWARIDDTKSVMI